MYPLNVIKYFKDRLLFIPLLAVLFIGINLAVVWNDAKLHDYVPCAENCGESFLIFKYVQDYHLYGFKYGLIEDRATNLDPDRTPYLYTHNANIPGMVFVFLDALGLKALADKQLFILFINGLGLYYIFLAISSLARSKLLGIIVLSLFCLDYEFVFNFALNPLRAWHWLVLFGLIYHTYLFVLESNTPSLRHKISIFIFNTLAFGLGYDFFVIALMITSLIIYIKLPRPLYTTKNGRLVLLFIFSAIFPFILRQFQIAFILGPKFWVMDVLYSIVTKVTFLKYFLSVPSNETITNYFLAKGVYRPETTGPLPLTELFAHLKMLVRYTLLPITGISTLLLTIIMTSLATLITILAPIPYFKNFFKSLFQKESWQKVLSVSHLIVIIVLGSMIGIAVFPQHNIQIYIKHLVPLLAASFFVVKGAVIFLLLLFLVMSKTKTIRFKSMLFAAMLLFIITDHLKIQMDNIHEKHPYDMRWVSTIQKRPNATFAISWMPTAISVFTNNEVVSLSQTQQEDLLNRLQLGKQPFEQITDYTVPLRTQITAQNEQIIKPDYWLYFSTDNMSPFDHPAPNCRLDYLSAALKSVLGRKNTAHESTCIKHVSSPRLPMPSADKLIAENSDIPIAARGSDWVLFDLRSLYKSEDKTLSTM